jgi:aldehyde dehydrogenase (NAD+)
MIKDILTNLRIKPLNSGACSGLNHWSSTANRSVINSFNPSNQSCIAEIAIATADDYEKIIQHAQEYFNIWRMVPAPKRGDIIRQLGESIRIHKEDLAKLISLENGKSLEEARGEVQEMIDMADFAVGQSRMLYGLTMPSERPQHRLYEQWHPLGVVGIITAFNFPMAVWAWNAFLAVIAGNTVVWKPSSKTPLCAIAIQHLCNMVMKHNHCEGLFSLFISNQHDNSTILLDDERIPLISFTGSTQVGQVIASALAKRFGRCLLECSGNNAIIIDETADLSLVIPSVVFGAIGTAGQRCTSTRRLILQETIAERIITSLIETYSQLKIGDPLNTQNHMGPLIDNAAVAQYEKTIAAAVKQGGEILYGAKRLTKTGCFVEPTLIRANPTMPIIQDECFAPILYIMSYQDFNQAIDWQNNVPQGLSSSLFTQDLSRAEQFLSSIGSDCGIANINIGTSGAEIGGAFGGEKETGGGRESGSDSWRAYMRRQSNTVNYSKELPLAQGIKFDI